MIIQRCSYKDDPIMDSVMILSWMACRVKLVEVLLGDTPPSPEEEDPHLRAALLQSLKDFEAPQEDRRSRASTSGKSLSLTLFLAFLIIGKQFCWSEYGTPN